MLETEWMAHALVAGCPLRGPALSLLSIARLLIGMAILAVAAGSRARVLRQGSLLMIVIEFARIPPRSSELEVSQACIGQLL